MTEKEVEESRRVRLKGIVASHYAIRHAVPLTKNQVLERSIADFRKEDQVTQNAAFREAARFFYGELERRKDPSTGLRDAECVGTNGDQLSLELLDSTFRQAYDVRDRKERHARGASFEAAFTRHIVTVAEERCRERGLIPLEVAFTLSEFLDREEVAEIRATFRQKKTA